jgi:hypothetical protein
MLERKTAKDICSKNFSLESGRMGTVSIVVGEHHTQNPARWKC